MKTNLLFLLFLAKVGFVFSQSLFFSFQNDYKLPLHPSELKSIKTLNDVIRDYPSAWIDVYESVELICVRNGESIRTESKNEILSEEQIQLLQNADLNTDVYIHIAYTYKNPVDNKIEHNEIKLSRNLVAEKEAEFNGGEEALKTYMQHSTINAFIDPNAKLKWGAIVRFTVNEQGWVVDPIFIRDTGNAERDRVIKETLLTMPAWKSAETADGKKVPQVFELRVGNAELNSGGC